MATRALDFPRCRDCLYAQDHNFGGLDEGSCRLAFFQTHFTHGVRRYYRSNLLPRDRQGDLRHDPFDLNVDNTTNELIARTDSPELRTTLRRRHSLFCEVKVSVQFAFRNPVMPTLCFDGSEFACMDPPL